MTKTKQIESEIEAIVSGLKQKYCSKAVDRLHELRVNLRTEKERDKHRMTVFQERIEIVG